MTISRNGTLYFYSDNFSLSSTYLVAFVMSDLEETKVTTSRGVAVSVYNRPGKKEATQTGLDTVKKVSFLRQIFDST